MIAIPFFKPILISDERNGHLTNFWSDDVCLQSSSSTCGPVSLATALVNHGDKQTERVIARASYSGGTGTELWYLLRYARQHGYRVTFVPVRNVTAIVVVTVGGLKHFIPILTVTSHGVLVGDPMYGPETLTEAEFFKRYGDIGNVMHITPATKL